jgi:hypothetical protein
MPELVHFDLETCGLIGPIVTIQMKPDGGDTSFYEVWKNPIKDTLDILEDLCEYTVCAWNLTFDWFHVNKWYNVFKRLVEDDPDKAKRPPQIWDVVFVENKLPRDYCLKPRGCLDLFSYARSGPLQHLLVGQKERKIEIKKVPTQAAYLIKDSLPLPEKLYFYKVKKKDWTIEDYVEDGIEMPEFKNLILRLGPTTSLKPIMRHIFGFDTIDYPIPKHLLFKEREWKPWGGQWPYYIQKHIDYWHTDVVARKYAKDDVVYLDYLNKVWQPPIPPAAAGSDRSKVAVVDGSNQGTWGDDNSILTVATACARWHGIDLDQDEIKHQIINYNMIQSLVPTAPVAAKAYIIKGAAQDDETAKALARMRIPDTKKETLEAIVNTTTINQNCEIIPDELATRAQQVINARSAEKRLDILKKLQEAKRFFPQFITVGTKSDRMAGTGGLNAQGIPREDSMRQIFLFNSGGDFDAFEVTIIDAAYPDAKLHEDLLDGRNIHAKYGALLYSCTYEAILASKSTKDNKYNPAKNTVFSRFYGAHLDRQARTAGVSLEAAGVANKAFSELYPDTQREWEKIRSSFCSVHQPAGLGTQILWKKPAEFIESLFGYRRYYKLENYLVKELFHLAENLQTVGHAASQQEVGHARENLVGEGIEPGGRPGGRTLQETDGRNGATHQGIEPGEPGELVRSGESTTVQETSRNNDKIPTDKYITRRKSRGRQTIEGATRSALYATVFALQQRNMRSAANHKIQCSGAEITKRLQVELWELQPVGVRRWEIVLYNGHDEIAAVHDPSLNPQVQEVIDGVIKIYRETIPLLKMDWKFNMHNWSDK